MGRWAWLGEIVRSDPTPCALADVLVDQGMAGWNVEGALPPWSPSLLLSLQGKATKPTFKSPMRRVGGGKPKMRWYFGLKGWPTSSVLGGAAPRSDEQQALLIDTLQDWKTDKYKDIVGEWQFIPGRGWQRDGGLALRVGVGRWLSNAGTPAASPPAWAPLPIVPSPEPPCSAASTPHPTPRTQLPPPHLAQAAARCQRVPGWWA